MFTIQKDLNGIFWHIYNNARSIVNVSDFDVVIDDVSNTFIIQCKNGSNIPNQAISISLIQVIDLSVGTSPILFSGANGLIQLLTAKGYTPYLQVPPSVSVVVYRVGQVGVFTMTPTQFTDNFTETGLGTNTMLGWALRNGNNGTKNQQGKFSLNKGVSPYDVIGTLGGSANSVLIGHDHESAVFSNGRKGVNDTGTGGTFNGNVLVEAEANQKIVKTSIKGQSNTGADVPSEDGVGKNMPPYLIDVWVERVTELVINSGSGGGGSNTLQEVLTEGNNADNTIELENSTNITTIEQGSIYTKNKASTAGVGFSEQGIDIYTQNESLAVGIKTDNISEPYTTQFPNKIGGAEETFAMVSDILPSAVDSVNGQTGVVVLDAADVGAEPTKGSDDNYVTDAQLVVIGNTSGTNTGDNATNTKYDVTATTGAVISFATPQIYNSIASPSSSNITDNLTGARIGVVQKIYHNAGTAPTVPAGWVLRGTGAYVTSTLNIIYAEWSVGTTVEYWITQ